MLNVKKKLIGQVLLEKGLITNNQLEQALNYQRNNPNKRIGEVLVELGYITYQDLAKALAESLNIPYIDLLKEEIDESLILKFNLEVLKQYKFIPIRKDQSGIVLVGLVDPLDNEAINIARSTLNIINIEIGVIDYDSFNKVLSDLENKFIINEALKEISVKATSFAEDIFNYITLDDIVDKEGVIKLVEAIFKQAITYRASDIHIEPLANNVRVRYRIDGILQKGLEFSYESFNEVVSRIKLLASLNITEHRLPQDGHVIIKTRNGEFDLRVSVLPSRYGEKIVIRILDKQSTILSLDKLGFNNINLEKVYKIISKPYGFILVSGPTGGGKTTTLFSMLKELDIESKNVVTIEDPIEYEIPGITQVQVNEKIGLTFYEGLKYILRQDPDVILIGEIRDNETLHTAIQASLTGHLVLATIHANDAISTILRIKEMIIGSTVKNEYLFSSLIGIINQRLVRILCNNCKSKIKITKKELLNILSTEDIHLIDYDYLKDYSDSEFIEVYQSIGCPVCNWIGYLGRTMISEVLIFDNYLRELLESELSPFKIKQILRKEKKQLFLIDDAIFKVISGITTLQEIKRVI
ncbi:MAG: GspE/PulE family protein [bacterium]|jgi:type IV pilus assembly protein PilB